MAEPKPMPTPEDDAALRHDVEDGIASLEQGRGVAYETVRRWLLSWGTDKETPPPECP